MVTRAVGSFKIFADSDVNIPTTKVFVTILQNTPNPYSDHVFLLCFWSGAWGGMSMLRGLALGSSCCRAVGVQNLGFRSL